MDMEVLALASGAVDLKGNSKKVALYSDMFLQGMRLPFCHPMHDVLAFLGMTSAQVHPNA